MKSDDDDDDGDGDDDVFIESEKAKLIRQTSILLFIIGIYR